MAELLADLPDGREVAEWQAYLRADNQVQDLVAKGTKWEAAYAMVWDRPGDDEEA